MFPSLLLPYPLPRILSNISIFTLNFAPMPLSVSLPYLFYITHQQVFSAYFLGYFSIFLDIFTQNFYWPGLCLSPFRFPLLFLHFPIRHAGDCWNSGIWQQKWIFIWFSQILYLFTFKIEKEVDFDRIYKIAQHRLFHQRSTLTTSIFMLYFLSM